MKDVVTQNLLMFGGVLFVLGMVGFLTRRSLILMFLSLETMLAGVSVNLIVFGQHHKNYQGQVLSIMVLTIAACEAAIALALVVSLYRRKPSLDVRVWDELSETLTHRESDPPVTFVTEHLEFPKLTPSGLDPMAHPMPASFDALTGELVESQKPTATEASKNA